MTESNASNQECIESDGMNEASLVVKKFKRLFERMSYDTDIEQMVNDVYGTEMVFEDCFHRLEGKDSFRSYCKDMYKNVLSCEFVFHQDWINRHDAMISWTLTYRHKFLKRGQCISVDGTSLIRFGLEGDGGDGDKIFYHRDYIDGGSMLYEHIPLLGTAIRQLKKRLI